ncbi:MAG: hypothetical protein AABX34_05825 [Nanoarchaeota archaeon]
MVRILFGGKTPQTAMSIKELSDKMAYAERDIRVLVGRHAAITDPLQRAEMEMQIAEKFSLMEDLASKFKKAFLDRLDRNSRYIFKLLSGMDLRALLSRWPDPQRSLTNYLNRTNKTIDAFRQDEFEDIQKSYGLRGYANEIKKRVRSNIDSTANAIGQKISSIKKQIESKRKEMASKQNAPSHERL